MEPKTTGKRIVSKGAYANAQGKRVGIGLMGLSIVLFAFLLLYIGWFFGTGQVPYWRGIYGFVMFLWLLFCAHHVARYGRSVIKKVIQLDPGVPLTRANTADLPAPESLVRASAEPMQAQEAVLLRAAAEGQNTRPEQLVRAAGSQAVT